MKTTLEDGWEKEEEWIDEMKMRLEACDLRETMLSRYLDSDSPDYHEAEEIMQMKPDEIKSLFALWSEVIDHDGCVSNEDSVRLSLYLWKASIRKVDFFTEDPPQIH